MDECKKEIWAYLSMKEGTYDNEMFKRYSWTNRKNINGK